ncbi:MAG TPA: hypothetical protein VLA77_04090 [Candidatus Saccharimonadales bacterium]|nr:hypothetical protein [Candidatus Saccharimonadales bacterium]
MSESHDLQEHKEIKRSKKKKIIFYVAAGMVGVFILVGGLYGYLYASTPEHIRKPTFQHYHFRTQVLVDSKAVDFSEDEFQKVTGASAACSAAVGGTPIDFHDKTDQLTHVHWNGMTGGEFLKYFGWNFIGGSDELLGWRYDAGLIPSEVKIYGKLLPAAPESAKFYIYVGDKNNYQQKDWGKFIESDLETFFGKQSNIGHGEETSFNPLDWFFKKAYAHGGVADEHPSDKSEEELSRINNLIGNVVIFAQEQEPTKEQIQARFNNLVPLHESSCGD